MSLARQAVRGATWNIASSLAARLIGVVATLGLTHLLAPDAVGEVAVAVIIVQSANQFSTVGFGQFIVVHPQLPATSVFQVALLHLGFGAVALAAVVALSGALAGPLEVPNLVDYAPGIAIAALIGRFAVIPERVLIRDMKFSPGANGRALGEVSYAVVAVSLAALDWGGQAIVIGNVVRSVVFTSIVLRSCDRSLWLRPHRLEAALCRRVLRFGVPLWMGATANFLSSKWDSLLYSSFFGARQVGFYTLGYSLADVPTQQVAEHIGDVLIPSFARLDETARRRAIVRAAGLLALLVFPLAIGLGATSKTLVAVLFDEQWQELAVFVAILSPMSVAQPIGAIIQAFLQASLRTGAVMGLELCKLVAVLGSIAALAFLGPHWAAAGVGVGYFAHTILGMRLIARSAGVPVGRMLSAVAGPLAACAPMVAAVLGVRHGLGLAASAPVAGLALEVAAGAVAYCGIVLVTGRTVALDLLGLLRTSFRGRSAKRMRARG